MGLNSLLPAGAVCGRVPGDANGRQDLSDLRNELGMLSEIPFLLKNFFTPVFGWFRRPKAAQVIKAFRLLGL